VADTVKCNCPECGAKYRLPVEYQGRHAKCKKCGKKFQIPAGEKSLEDSVLDWLSEAENKDDQEDTVEQPRVVSMSDSATPGGSRHHGPIRRKQQPAEEESESARKK
jgi:tRNA(Ile2) C34 agmatinyltransferase TiaS